MGARGWTALLLLGLATVAIVAATSDPSPTDPTDPTAAAEAQVASSPEISAASPLISAASPLELLDLAWLGIAPPLMGFLVATINGTLGMRF